MDSKLKAKEWHNRFSDQLKWTSQLRNHVYERIDFSQYNNLLEVGCGTGALLSEISGKFGNLQLYGIDIDESRLEICRNFFRKVGKDVNLNTMDICYNVFPDESFDIIITNLVLLWIKDLDKAFKQIHRILKKNGIFIIFTEPDYGGMIEHPETGVKKALIDNLIQNGADPRVGRKIGVFIGKNKFRIVERYSPSVPWLASSDREGLLAELNFFRKILPESFDYMGMRKSIESGEYFLYNPSFCYILMK